MSDSVRAIVNTTRPIDRSVSFTLVAIASLSLLTADSREATGQLSVTASAGATNPAYPYVGQQTVTPVTATLNNPPVFATGPTYAWMVVSALYSPSGTPVNPTTSGYYADFANPTAAQTNLLVTAYAAGNWQFNLKVAVSGTTSGSYPSGTTVSGEAFVSVLFAVHETPTFVILRDLDGQGKGEELTDKNKTVLAGQEVKLLARLNGKLINGNWVLDPAGKAFKDYKYDNIQGIFTPLDPKSLKDTSSIDFYWAEASDTMKVKCTCNVGGVDVSKEVTMVVKKPKYTFESTIGDVFVGKYPFDKTLKTEFLALAKSKTELPGISFKAKVMKVDGFGGDLIDGYWFYRQTVVPDQQIEEGATKLTFDLNGKTVLDTSVPYTILIGRAGKVDLGTEEPTRDSPAFALIGKRTLVSVNNHYKMYLMFMPPPITKNGELSTAKAVPLAYVEWFWKGKTSNGKAGWSDPIGPDKGANPAVSTSDHPTWIKSKDVLVPNIEFGRFVEVNTTAQNVYLIYDTTIYQIMSYVKT